MTAFSIKVPDDLLADLQNHLHATGQSRSAFVRELIERELRGEAARRAELRARLMHFAGICGRDAPSASPTALNVAGNVKQYLRDGGFGMDNADRAKNHR